MNSEDLHNQLFATTSRLIENANKAKTKSKGLTAIKNVVNLIHLPSPGVQVTKEYTPQYKLLLLN